MDDAPPSMPQPPRWLAALVRARHLHLILRGWWVSAVLGAVAGYGAAASAGGLLVALVGGSLLVVVAVVGVLARNASAEAVQPGSVRRGSLLRAAGFGLLLHGALLSLGWASGGALLAALSWFVLGALVVGLSRPTSVLALGVTVEPAVAPPTSRSRSTAELVAALRASTHEVRTTVDPWRKAELAEQRGTLIDELQARDPQLLRALMDEFVPPAPQSDDGVDRT
jgi:hypothetical protein